MRQSLALAAVSLALAAAPALAQDLPANADPVFVEAYSACIGAIDNGGFLDEFFGWIGHDSGDPDAIAYETYSHGFATKELDGVGGLNLSATVEKYPGYELGTCVVRMEEPQAEIDGPDLKHTPGFTGTLQGDAGSWSGAWRNDEASLFIRAGYSEAEYFTVSMTKITQGGGFP